MAQDLTWTDSLYGTKWQVTINAETGKILKRQPNVNAFFIAHPQIQGRLSYDECSKRVLIDSPPWRETSGPVAIEHVDHLEAQHWLSGVGLDVSQEMVSSALLMAANQNKVNRITQFVSDLPEWDGVERLSTWISKYLGVEDTQLVRAYSRCWLIGAMARACEPGTKMDNVLVIYGKQGIKKSTALSTLFGREMFTDAVTSIKSRDDLTKMLGKWCVEFAEMAAFDRTTEEQKKAFLTQQFDEYRLPYQRENVTAARQMVFACTTNEHAVFSDATGNRRYWPVHATVIDVEGIESDRLQLLSEARQAYREGEPHYLSAEMEQDSIIETAQYDVEDTWEEIVQENAAAIDMERLTTGQILHRMIGLPAKDHKKGDAIRLGRILRKHGFRNQAVREHGNVRKGWILFE